MVNELGPWSLKGILAESFRIYQRHFLVLFFISPVLWRQLGGQLLALKLPGLDQSLDAMLTSMPLSAHIIFGVFMRLTAMPILIGAMMLAIGHLYVQGGLAVRESFRQCLRRYPALLGVTVIPTVVLLGILGLSLMAGGIIWRGHGSGFTRFSIAAFVVVIGVILMLRVSAVWGLIYQAVLFENRDPIAALKASEDLTYGHRWAAFFVAVILDVCLASIPNLNNVPPMWVQVTLSSLLYPIAVISAVLLYFSLRMEKNGFTPCELARTLDEPVSAYKETGDGLYPDRG